MDLGLGERAALVTGASRGIGRACADALVAEGARVFAVGRDEAALAGLAAEHPGQVAYGVCDLSTDGGCYAAAQGPWPPGTVSTCSSTVRGWPRWATCWISAASRSTVPCG